MIKPVKKLDVHGMRYEDATREIEYLLNLDWRNIDGEIEIVTGNGQLKDYLMKRIQELDLRWRYHPLTNTGCIRIFE